ncbi:esterase-like activity of phytase family protein [Ampullimonas aquatilis]|uniref:esterase-like activity of phytase family protein n=1 Tax=Ampullimonas aquatilis TaxID=1341549 RepID=UPI003C72AE90
MPFQIHNARTHLPTLGRPTKTLAKVLLSRLAFSISAAPGKLTQSMAQWLALPIILTGCTIWSASSTALKPQTTTATGTTLIGRALLPAATFAKGPVSGQYLGKTTINGQALPFASQPVQGFSAMLDNHDGSFLAMTDNGYGALENSADFHLRVYTIRPDFQGQSAWSSINTHQPATDNVKIESFFELRDPQQHIPFAITQHFSRERILTGADFDIESMQRSTDGTLWFGDEFGPFLLHTDAQGVVLEPPISLPDFAHAGQTIRSPQNPFNEEGATLRIMNAVRYHAQQHGNQQPPVFSPHHVLLALPETASGMADESNPARLSNNPDHPNHHYARGQHPQPGLIAAASDIFELVQIKAAGYPVITWTVNDPVRMQALLQAGVSGMISDRPDLLWQVLSQFEQGKLLDEHGLIDPQRFDAQGHRGGRDLRPENTLPAFEVALDNLMNTIETDSGISADGVPMLMHDPYLQASKCRRLDGQPYLATHEQLIKNLTQHELQTRFICDKLIRGASQRNDPSLSPVANLLAKRKGYHSIYLMPSLQDLFDLVQVYADYYQHGAGKSHPQARLRALNAQRVRFNIETKINPRQDTDQHGRSYRDRTVAYDIMADALIKVITSNGMQTRADIQSFDFRTLLHVQTKASAIRTVYLFGDAPIYDDPRQTDDGTNLQDEHGANTPWLAGLPWPYRSTKIGQPFRAQRSGGFEGMAINPDGSRLYPMLELALTGDDPKTLLIHEFEISTRRYTGRQFKYRLDERGSNIGDFILFNEHEGLVLERDNSQGDLHGFKKVFLIKLGKAGEYVQKTELVDLLRIADPQSAGSQGQTGDVGLSNTIDNPASSTIGGTTHKIFAMPFVTIESMVVLDEQTIAIANDNNFPSSIGRHINSQQADDTEMILIHLPTPLTLVRPMPKLKEAPTQGN